MHVYAAALLVCAEEGSRLEDSNSCSLNGSLAAPVRLQHDSCDQYPKAYTFISVLPSSSAPSSRFSRSNFLLL
ncbi:hypothetical protein EJB05_05652 [Eragrostis curvula]|uniref:Uncharacterized protein n=1 Tax=Eragrostis curvula TaxID=38414 RepID=A0A5J9WFU0_9POAL|nr:hypothetical protein EJB05_05652 [Eragrostis curvula]